MARPKHFVLWQGEMITINELCVRTGDRGGKLYHRILRAGMSPEEAVSAPPLSKGGNVKPYMYWFRGQRMTIYEAMRITGKSRSEMLRRVFHNTILDGEELAEMRSRLPDYRRNARLLRLGIKTRSLTEWADELRIPRTTLHYRLNAGWPLVPALFTPRRNYTFRTRHSHV